MKKDLIRIVRLTEDYEIKPFDCGNDDLNDFLLNDAKDYALHRLAVTYLLETEEETVGYFSVSNDKLSINESDKPTWRRIKHLFDHRKHRSDYPAVKVGRLAVNKKYQGRDIGTDIFELYQMYVCREQSYRMCLHHDRCLEICNTVLSQE